MAKQRLTTRQLACRVVRNIRQAGLDLVALEQERARRAAVAHYQHSFRVLTSTKA